MSKTPVRVEIVTWTVMLTHVFAAAEAASTITTRVDWASIFSLLLELCVLLRDSMRTARFVQSNGVSEVEPRKEGGYL